MRRVKNLLFAGLLLAANFSFAANSLVWDAKKDAVSADIRGEPLWPLLEDIAHQTGWHIFVEPGLSQKADVKFSGLNSGDALKKLLGSLNYAYVPKTNEANQLYIFATTMRAATVRVSNSATTNKPALAKHVPNELIVKVKPGTDIDALAKSLGAKVIGRNDKLGLYRLQFGDAAATDTALATLKNNSAVATVEYNYLFDPPTVAQKIAGAADGPVSLKLNPPGDSGRVIVGLIDTSIQSLGSTLDPFLLTPVNVTGDTVANGDDPTHATDMAETILRAMAAQGGGTSAQILPVDVYGNSSTATTWNVALGVQAAVDGGATILNLSLGGMGGSQVLGDVIAQAEANGIIVFAATGNNGENTVNYPAAYSGVIAVAATQGSQLAPYSNYGSETVMALPGASIVYLGGQTYIVQGTSPATAYAAGIAAGTRSSTSLTWAQILTAMQQKFPVPAK
jgi:Subtilase family